VTVGERILISTGNILDEINVISNANILIPICIKSRIFLGASKKKRL